MIQLLFFRQVFLLISHKAGKAKWIEKRSVRSRPVKQVFLYSKLSTINTWYIHIFALFELYLVQLDYKIKLSRCTPHRCSTTISLETKPIYSYVVNYNACSWCEAKSNQNILNRLRLEQKSPKNSAYFVYTYLNITKILLERFT